MIAFHVPFSAAVRVFPGARHHEPDPERVEGSDDAAARVAGTVPVEAPLQVFGAAQVVLGCALAGRADWSIEVQ